MNSYRLVMRSGPNVGQEFLLESNEIIIGRDTQSDIVVNDTEVSRRHARLFLQGRGYVLEDLGSTNGTFVNGQRLMGPHLLIPGEYISLGGQTGFVFEAVQFDSDATRVANTIRPPVDKPVSVPQAYSPIREAAQPIPSVQPSPVQPNPVQPISPPPASQETYSGQVPLSEEEEPPKKKNNILKIVIIVLAILFVCFCVAAIIIDVADLYCLLFSSIVNSFIPNYCP